MTSPGSLFLVASRSWLPSGEGSWREATEGEHLNRSLTNGHHHTYRRTCQRTHGVLAFEHERPQTFVVDVTLHLDLAAAGQSDDLNDTIDYGRVAKDIVAVIEGLMWT